MTRLSLPLDDQSRNRIPELSPCPLCGQVVAEYARLRLEMLESMLDDVADGDDAQQASVIANHEVTESLASHPPHDSLERIVGIADRWLAHDRRGG
jgi:hypothetical protein